MTPYFREGSNMMSWGENYELLMKGHSKLGLSNTSGKYLSKLEHQNVGGQLSH